MKQCKLCSKVLDKSAFGKNKNTKDGLHYYCLECSREKNRAYEQAHREERRKRKRDARLYGDMKLKDKLYRDTHKEESYMYRRNRRPARNAWFREYNKNPKNRIRTNLRARFLQALKKNRKHGRTLDLIGCSIEELKQHIEAKFLDGMTRDNYGVHGWHIDHIRPLSSFDLFNEEEQFAAMHYTNLQPLWAVDNIRKGNNYTPLAAQ